MLAANGSNSDKKEFAKIIDDFSKQLTSYHGVEYYVADSALYSLEGIKTISKQVNWITRVPEILSESKSLISNADIENMKEINNNYKYSTHISEYANNKQRWILIFLNRHSSESYIH